MIIAGVMRTVLTDQGPRGSELIIVIVRVRLPFTQAPCGFAPMPISVITIITAHDGTDDSQPPIRWTGVDRA